MTQQPDKTRPILIEIAVYTVAMAVSLFFPIYISFPDSYSVAVPHYFTSMTFGFAYPLYFILVVFATLSLRKKLSRVINQQVLIFMAVTLFLLVQGFNWSGGAYQPVFGYGYWFSQAVTLLLIIRTYIWSYQSPVLRIPPKLAAFCSIAAVILLLSFIGIIVLFLYLYS